MCIKRYYVCVCTIALFIQHAQRMLSVILPTATSLGVHFFIYSDKRKYSPGRNEHKIFVMILSRNWSETFSIIRKIRHHSECRLYPTLWNVSLIY
jgi:hypothetical protein